MVFRVVDGVGDLDGDTDVYLWGKENTDDIRIEAGMKGCFTT